MLPAVAESLVVAGRLSTDSPIVPESALFDVLGGDGADDDPLFVPPLEVIRSEVEEEMVDTISYIPCFKLGIMVVLR